MQLQIQQFGFASPRSEKQQEIIDELETDLFRAACYLENDLKSFESMVDVPAFGYVEEEIVALWSKLQQIKKSPKDFMYQPSELNGLYLIKMTSVKEVH